MAAQEALAALGTDTGGSVRLPAAFCGVVGLKPSYGRISRYGLLAYGSSLDQIGTLTKSVYDAALLLNVMAGQDGRDSTSLPAPVPDYTQALTGDIRGLRVGLPQEYFIAGLQPATEQAVRAAVAHLAGPGGGDRAHQPAQHGQGAARLLPGGHRRGQRQPGALRRRALRPQRRRGRHVRELPPVVWARASARR